jgi:phosphoribosylanthranilate isomerase
MSSVGGVRRANTPRVKICCTQSVDEAWLAIDAGASALGFVSAMPSGPGIISDDHIAAIVRAVPPPIATFLLTCRQDVDAIVAQQRYTGANTLQLCDTVEVDSHRKLKAQLPGVSIVQVIHVAEKESIAEAVAQAEDVDALLLDTGDRSAAVKELGGTGRQHDWSISRKIRDTVSVPVFLAGGLRPENVAEAIRVVAPFGVDICSGLRPEGTLDGGLLREFFGAVRSFAN